MMKRLCGPVRWYSHPQHAKQKQNKETVEPHNSVGDQNKNRKKPDGEEGDGKAVRAVFLREEAFVTRPEERPL